MTQPVASIAAKSSSVGASSLHTYIETNQLNDTQPTRPSFHFSPQSYEALKIIEASGGEAWFVGGCVRDSLLGLSLHDVDIACSLPWKKTQQAFEAARWKTSETGVKHGTLTVYRNHEAFEVTTYRTESTYSDGRHPDSVLPARSIEEDLQRRDFTINAMAFHPTRGLLDPYGGLNDLTNALVCSVGDPLQRFSEDALRILRGCRFSSQLGFSLEENTFQAMLYKKHLLRKISGERIYSELERFVCGPFVHDALLNCVDVLSFVLPELLAMKNCPQVTKYHIYDVLEHTAYVMQNTPAKPLQRWTALFHDMGKPAAAFFEGEVEHFYGHAYVSVEIAESVMNRLPFPTALKHDVPLLVRVHDDYIEANHRCVKRALARLGGRTDLFEALCDIKAGDALGQAPFCAARADEAEELRALMHEILENEEAFSVKHLHIKGSDLIEMGYQPGPLFKEILETVLEAVVNEEIPNEQEELCAFVRAQFPLE